MMLLISFQSLIRPLAFLMKYCSMLRNRMLADPSFLFKVGTEGRSVISVNDTLKIIAWREQHKKLSALEMELAAARQEGFTSMLSTEINGTDYKRRPLVVIGIFTTSGRNRDAIHKAWMGTGAALKIWRMKRE